MKFSQDLTQQKSLKSVNFWQSYWKNKRWTFFGTQCRPLSLSDPAISHGTYFFFWQSFYVIVVDINQQFSIYSLDYLIMQNAAQWLYYISVTFTHVRGHKVSKVKHSNVHLSCALSCYIFKVLRYAMCVIRASHSFTCHPRTNHPCLCCLPDRCHCPLAGTRCAYPRRDGQAVLALLAV